jgi:hypothetical protein
MNSLTAAILVALCIHGHPVKRPPDCATQRVEGCITYGGLPSKHGYQRDHLCSLELGCPDTADNVRYQRCDIFGPHGRCLAGPAADKDADEHEAGVNMCSGRQTPQEAREWLAKRWFPYGPAQGYD